MTEKELVKAILAARTKEEYKTIDVYLTKYPNDVTDQVSDALEAYEMYRQTLEVDETSTK
jgi:hypothetical protein